MTFRTYATLLPALLLAFCALASVGSAKTISALPIQNDLKYVPRSAAPTELKATNTATLSSDVLLKCGNCDVKEIVCIPSHELVAVATRDSKVFIYEYASQGEPIHVFSGKTNGLKSLIHLCDDIMASVDNSGNVLTWRARTGIVLDKLKVIESGCSAITKASATIILVGTPSGEIIIVEHANGKNLREKKRCKITSDAWIYDIRAYNDILVVFANGNAQVWNYSQAQLMRTIISKGSTPAAVSDDFIVMCEWWGCKLYVHQMQGGYNLLKTIDLHKFKLRSDNDSIQDITFLNGDIVMVTTRWSGIFIVSVQTGQCISHCKLKESVEPVSLAVLSDGRVCVGGWHGYCSIFKPSQEIGHFVAEYSQHMLPSHGPSSIAGQANEVRNISQLWNRLEAMETRNKAQESDIAKMNMLCKEQESAMEKLKIQNKQQQTEIEKMQVLSKVQNSETEKLKVQNKQQEREIEKLKVLNKEHEIRIANMELSYLKQDGKMNEKIEMLEQQYEAQKDKIAQLEQPNCKIRRIS